MDYKPKIKLSQDEFRVLASNTRIDILKLLDESQFTVSDISRKLDMNKATVHEHLSKLMEVGLVKKDDSPRKWVYYRLTWKGRNLLHPERVRVMVSLGILLTVIVVGALIIAMSTDFTTTTPPDDPNIPMAQTTVDVFWEDSGQTNVYDIHVQASTALTVASVDDLDFYIEPNANTATYATPVVLDWAWETDVIHLYDYQEKLEDHLGEYLYVEGTLLDDRAVERPFNLYRYLVPTEWEIDLRISDLGIDINTSRLDEGLVSISFEVENAGDIEVNDTCVEVFSVHPRFRGIGFPTYGSPYLWELFNTTVSLDINASEIITFDIPVSQLYRTGVMVVVDPDNSMPEMPVENNMATEEIPQDVLDINSREASDGAADESVGMNLGFVAIPCTS
jgi:DNA-binding transcriptional ArsR family regulator